MIIAAVASAAVHFVVISLIGGVITVANIIKICNFVHGHGKFLTDSRMSELYLWPSDIHIQKKESDFSHPLNRRSTRDAD